MSFAEVRPYQSGDEVRSIDWNVTARKRAPYIKVFEEERELTLFLLLDISASTNFGTKHRTKQDLQIEIAATLAFSAMGNNDKIGLILFAGEIEKVIPPKKGKKHVMRIIKTILEWEASTIGTNIEGALEHLLKIQKRHSNVFLMSDFLGDKPDRNFRIAAKRYDLCAISTFDQKETVLPNVGLIPLKDAESGAIQWVNSRGKEFAKHLLGRHQETQEAISALSKRSGSGYLQLDKDQDFVPPLLNYLKSKSR